MTNKEKLLTDIGALLIDAVFDKIAPDAVSDLVFDKALATGETEDSAAAISDLAAELAGLISPPDEDWELGDDIPDEEAELALLASNKAKATDKFNDYMERGFDGFYHFSVLMNGHAHTFLLGGPQLSGLDQMIDNICRENGHDIN